MPKRIRLITLNPATSEFFMEPQLHILYEDATGTFLRKDLLGDAIFCSGVTADFAVVDNTQPGIVQSLDGTLPTF